MAWTVGAGQGGVLMEPDTAPRPLDHVERAHLRSPGDASHVMYRYEAAPEFAGLLERFWIPVWSVPPGREAPQQVLQYPVTLLVVSGDYARFYGVVSGLSTTTLTGDGWAVGVMCAPAADALVAQGSVAPYTVEGPRPPHASHARREPRDGARRRWPATRRPPPPTGRRWPPSATRCGHCCPSTPRAH